MPELTITEYNLTLCRLESRLQHIYYGQPYAGVDFIAQSGTKNSVDFDRLLKEVLREKDM
jgi:hypothetical protein